MISKKLGKITFGWDPNALKGKGYWYVLGKDNSFSRAASAAEASKLGVPKQADMPKKDAGKYYWTTNPKTGKPMRKKNRTGSDYETADITASKGLMRLASERMMGGQGLGGSLMGATKEFFGAKAKQLQSKFDPLNLASKIPGVGTLATTALGKATGRSAKDISYYSGVHAPEEEEENDGGDHGSSGKETASRIADETSHGTAMLIKIYNLLAEKLNGDTGGESASKEAPSRPAEGETATKFRDAKTGRFIKKDAGGAFRNKKGQFAKVIASSIGGPEVTKATEETTGKSKPISKDSKSPTGILTNIYNLLSKKFDEDKKSKELSANFDEEKLTEQEKEQKDLIKALEHKDDDKKDPKNKEEKHGWIDTIVDIFKNGFGSFLKTAGKFIMSALGDLLITAGEFLLPLLAPLAEILLPLIAAVGAVILVAKGIEKIAEWFGKSPEEKEAQSNAALGSVGKDAKSDGTGKVENQYTKSMSGDTSKTASPVKTSKPTVAKTTTKVPEAKPVVKEPKTEQEIYNKLLAESPPEWKKDPSYLNSLKSEAHMQAQDNGQTAVPQVKESTVGTRVTQATQENQKLTGPSSKDAKTPVIVNKTTNVMNKGGNGGSGSMGGVRDDESVLHRVQYQNMRPV